MPRTSAIKQYNTFVKGLITEANPLTYPENASLEEDNFVLKRNGSRERRLGIDFESGYTLQPTGLSATVLEGTRESFSTWFNPGGDTSVSIGVVRVLDKLWFIDLLTNSPSSNLLNAGNPITISGLGNADIETAVINSLFIIVSENLVDPIKLTYSPATGLVSQETYTIEIRDLYGVDDALTIDERPYSLTAPHLYNLRNQGWSTKIQSVCVDNDPAICTATYLGYYPSNADIWSLGKVGDATAANFEKYDPATMIRNSIDNSQAAKGSFIINARSRGTSRFALSGVGGVGALAADQEQGNFTTIAAYAGRVFYSGIVSNIVNGDSRSPNYSNYIFFTQIITTPDKLGKCYQEADPTSPNISDIIDTDGGTIQIPEATRIYRIIATKSSLIVFAENGMWEVFGDSQGFVATSYQSSKLSDTGCSSPKSVIMINGAVFAWAKAGIHALTQDPTSGRYTAENLSLLTIQTLYNNLLEVSKNNAKGFYDEKENTIRWLYNDTASYVSSSYVNKYNRELVLDLTLQAFYTNSINAATTYISDYVDLPNYTVTNVTESIFVGTDEVFSSTDAIVINTDTITSRITQFSFLTMSGTSFTISKYNNRVFRDWFTIDGVGVDFSSYLLTGYEVFGEIVKTKSVPYIWFYLKKTEDGFSTSGSDLLLDNESSCLVSARWEWTDSVNSGQWPNQFQAYRFLRNYLPTGASDTFDNGYSTVVTKNRIRGSGRCLSLYIQSETGKDMKLLGWAIMTNTENNP